MNASIATICDPSAGDLTEAIRQAAACAQSDSSFDIDLSRFLQMQCFSDHLHLPVIFRGLEVLEAITEERKLLNLLRPFLRSSDPQIASKCVLVLGRRSQTLGWIKNVLAEVDDRIRANLVESFWRRTEPEIELVMRTAMRDANHRVAANAAYGLYLLGLELYKSGLDDLITSENPARRRSAIWVIKMIGSAEASVKIKPLIRDPDAGVRRAAFQAMVYIREHPSRGFEAREPAANTEPESAAAIAE